MKIPRSVRQFHDDLTNQYEYLKREVDSLLRNRKRSSWHYDSRLKTLESFAIKLESGRWRDQGAVDDMLAAVVVVENLPALRAAEDLVARFFDVKRRRPKSAVESTTRAECFPFDDVRLYVEWPSGLPVPKPKCEGLIFEVQLRTFLQHAWNIATHDIVYKTREQSWAKDRLAAQVRASLEHAEITLSEMDRWGSSQTLARTDHHSRRLREISVLLQQHWEEDALPEDLKGLSANVERLMKAADLSVERLDGALTAESLRGRGNLPQNLSPFSVIIQALLRAERDVMRKLLTRKNRGFAIWIPAELEVPDDLGSRRLRDVVMLDD